jgi:hypothetical protein
MMGIVGVASAHGNLGDEGYTLGYLQNCMAHLGESSMKIAVPGADSPGHRVSGLNGAEAVVKANATALSNGQSVEVVNPANPRAMLKVFPPSLRCGHDMHRRR